MRGLVGLFFFGFVLWCGYWFIGAKGVETGVTTWIEDRQSEGWVAEYDDVHVLGFPNRFDTTLDNIHLADPDSGLAWSAPFFQMLALSYKPNHLIAVWPEQHSLSTPYQTITLRSGSTQASVLVQPDTKLALERTTLVTEDFVMHSTLDWQVRLPQATFAVELQPDTDATYRIGLQADKARLSNQVQAFLGAQGLPETFETLHLDTTVGFDSPWDIRALQDRRPQPTQIDLRRFKATWGELDLQAAGTLNISPAGVAQGEITVRAQNWKQMIAMAVNAGAIPSELGDGLINGLNLIARLGDNPDVIDLPLTFKNGRISLGPVPLGPAPLFAIR